MATEKSSLQPPRKQLQPCNLKTYAQAKGLPIEYLRKLGLSDRKYQGKDAVRIPYSGVDGQEIAVRFRLALEKSEEVDERFKWRSGSKTALYGLWRLEKIRKASWVVLVEGESDAQTLWYHGIVALGIPGVDTWKAAWAEHLEGIEKVFAVIEPDQGGQTLRQKLSATAATRDRLYLADLGEHKDPSGLYLADRARFKDRFAAALNSAVSVVEMERKEAEAASRQAWGEYADLAAEPDILEIFAADLARSGVAGESRLAKLLYLAVTSRFLRHPVSVAMKGPSSGGKSFLIEQVLSFFPQSAYYALTAMSEHALAYSNEPLKHRFLVIFEVAGMSSDFATYLMRSLLSEGRVRYETVEKTAEGMKPRLIEREDPTGLIVTTTAVKLHPENETRLLSLTVTDTREQTRDVMAALAKESIGEKIDLKRWHALQEWLAGAEHRVTISYTEDLAELVPPVAVRLRRDFGAVLNLIKAHAILHQASRKRNSEGWIIAQVEDYAKVRELIAGLVSEGIEATVPATVREAVETLRKMQEGSEEPVTIAELARVVRAR